MKLPWWEEDEPNQSVFGCVWMAGQLELAGLAQLRMWQYVRAMEDLGAIWADYNDTKQPYEFTDEQIWNYTQVGFRIDVVQS